MTNKNQKQLGSVLWGIANELRDAMNADDFRDYMLSFLFLRYLSDNYETIAKKELAEDYPAINGHITPLQNWYEKNPITAFRFRIRIIDRTPINPHTKSAAV